MSDYVIIIFIMAIRKVPFVQGEYYHIYNRGVDKREIFTDQDDVKRFLESMVEFNVPESIGSIRDIRKDRENKAKKIKTDARCLENGQRIEKLKRLGDIVAYCLNINHFHLLATPISDSGISKFMHKLGMGYTKYYNTKYKRSGSLFEGKFKAVHIGSDEYLTHVSAYINLNDKVHQKSNRRKVSDLVKSSWDEYMGVKIVKGKNSNNKLVENPNDICKKDIILERYNHIKEYEEFALDSLQGILERRYDVDLEK